MAGFVLSGAVKTMSLDVVDRGGLVGQNFLLCDREQELLLPPSLREWLLRTAPPDQSEAAAPGPIRASGQPHG
jgi:hypothetical protein